MAGDPDASSPESWVAVFPSPASPHPSNRSDWIVLEADEHGIKEEEIRIAGDQDDPTMDQDDQESSEEGDLDIDGDDAFHRVSSAFSLIDVGPALSQIVLVLVLPLLPAKSAARCRCVCVDWRRWISTDFFLHAHSSVPRSPSGVFHSGDFTPFSGGIAGDIEFLSDAALSFLPEPAAVLSSSKGLVCCRGRFSLGYYVCNPASAEWAPIPPPANDHGDSPGVVIVFEEPWHFNFHADYHIVCAYQIADTDAGLLFGFEAFSSKNWAWRRSNRIATAGRILSPGVAAGGAAHWRTTMQMVVSYFPAGDEMTETGMPTGNDDVAEKEWPAGYDVETVWELGEKGGRLCCTCARGFEVVVRVLEAGGRWVEVRRVELWGYYNWRTMTEREFPLPMQQQGKCEVMFLDQGEKQLVEYDPMTGRERKLVQHLKNLSGEFIPYISSLLHVKRAPV